MKQTLKRFVRRWLYICGFVTVQPGFQSAQDISNVLLRRLITMCVVMLGLCFGLWIVCLIHIL